MCGATSRETGIPSASRFFINRAALARVPEKMLEMDTKRWPGMTAIIAYSYFDSPVAWLMSHAYSNAFCRHFLYRPDTPPWPADISVLSRNVPPVAVR